MGHNSTCLTSRTRMGFLGEVCGRHRPPDNRLPPSPLSKGNKLKQELAELGPELQVPPLGAVLHAPKYNPFSVYASQSLCCAPTRG